MSDLDLTKNTNFSQNQNTGSSQNLKDQVVDAGAEMKQRAGDALRASTDIARDKFKEAADAAKDVASGTADQLQGQAREKQRSGADFIERFAGNIREAARAFENDAPFAARGINSAAEYVEDAAKKIRHGSFETFSTMPQILPKAARRIPWDLVLAGFAVIRFPRNAAGWRFAKSVALSTRSRKLPLRIFSAASSTYSAAESMPRAAKGASFSKARAASRMLPANRSMKSAPDRCFSRAWPWSWSAVPEATSLAASAASLNLSRAISVDARKASPARCFISAPASTT